jgi:2-dehydropantoate 2-reductase
MSDNIKGELWAKLVMNCAYNAISAIGGYRYGQMMAVPEVREIMSAAVREIEALAGAKGVRIAMDGPVDTVLRFADFMPGAISSTAQDLARGRATEIDHLNGYIVRESAALGLAAPVNQTLHALVKLLEAKLPLAGLQASEQPATEQL